jgi:PAS domain S-box-containing protein
MAYRCRNDSAWTILYASEGCARLTGYTVDELVENRLVSYGRLVHEDDLPDLVQRVDAALAADRPFQVTYRLRTRDGGVRWVWDNGRGVGGPGAPFIEGLALDITEAREIEEQLRQVQGFEAVGQLTAGLAHDFNNLLSVILVDAELAKEELGSGAGPSRVLLDDIEQAARSGGELVQKFAAVARHSPLALQPTDLEVVVRDATPLLRRTVPENIELRLRLDRPVGLAQADGAAVQQILLNLVVNARDAMPQGGVLGLELSEADLQERHRRRHPWVVPGRYVCLTVSDTGVGMDRAVQERIFEPFFTTKPSGKGTGLGLAMVYGLVKQHRGYVHVYSEPGRGSTFRVYFPLAVEPQAVGVAAAPSSAPGGTETILLVEDESALRDAARRALEYLGYTVVMAVDGVEGLARLGDPEAGFDLVLSDLMLPRKSGADLLRAVRESGRAIPFLLMTGYGADQVEGWDRLASEVVLLQKPWTMPELARAVRYALDRGINPS